MLELSNEVLCSNYLQALLSQSNKLGIERHSAGLPCELTPGLLCFRGVHRFLRATETLELGLIW
ncbi:hypothetical protein I79_026201 [Cricetulus griseus]|uniref:Uncharacterized protein n=1 Tax=Cricetulus griseus TaxID=10029 RepID=G3IQ98_CRIGR|nr:hypothetical protein I79_026201 [Cricetulus griseus]